MILEQLLVFQWRNISRFEWQPHPRANLLVGSNAQGKTNLLEAVYALGSTRGLRDSDSDELISHGKDEALVKGKVRREQPQVSRDLELQLRRGQPKRVLLNGKKLAPFSKIFGHLTVVLFVPEDLQLVKAGPAARRAYMDAVFSQASPQYLESLQNYQRALKQRNAALRLLAEGQGSWDGVEAWDEALLVPGAALSLFRRQAIQALEPLAAATQARVAGSDEGLRLRLISNVDPDAQAKDEDELCHRYRLRLRAMASEERGRASTLVGPHRDDLELLLQERPARLFASQGQQRTTALALKLAEVRYLAQQLGENPILLLDDVLSELDLDRQSRLLGLLDEQVQTIVTSTHADGLAYRPDEVWKVSQGGFERA